MRAASFDWNKNTFLQLEQERAAFIPSFLHPSATYCLLPSSYSFQRINFYSFCEILISALSFYFCRPINMEFRDSLCFVRVSADYEHVCSGITINVFVLRGTTTTQKSLLMLWHSLDRTLFLLQLWKSNFIFLFYQSFLVFSELPRLCISICKKIIFCLRTFPEFYKEFSVGI